jgi:large conductance mechanosensitive channel protein
MSTLARWREEFKAFLLQGNLILLAVAFVIGLAFAAVVTAFVTDWVTPIIGAIFGGQGAFDELSFTIHNSVFHYGHFIDALITFVAIAFAVFFFVVKPLPGVHGTEGAGRRGGGAHSGPAAADGDPRPAEGEEGLASAT